MAKKKESALQQIGKGTQGIFNVIPKEARISLAVIGGGYLAWWLYKKATPTKAEEQQTQLEKEAKEQAKQGGGLSLPLSQYTSLANTLYDSFMSAFGTDEDSIYGVFNKLSTDGDVAKLIAAFGYRRQEWGFTDYDLPYFMKDELDATEIRYVNQILSAKNIKYRF
jgi:hypothetical protein